MAEGIPAEIIGLVVGIPAEIHVTGVGIPVEIHVTGLGIPVEIYVTPWVSLRRYISRGGYPCGDTSDTLDRDHWVIHT